jgi:hypothetical protein
MISIYIYFKPEKLQEFLKSDFFIFKFLFYEIIYISLGKIITWKKETKKHDLSLEKTGRNF